MYSFGSSSSSNTTFKSIFNNGPNNHQRNVAHCRIDDEEVIFKKYELGKKLGQVCENGEIVFKCFERENKRSKRKLIG
jgi:hypothetical protein